MDFFTHSLPAEISKANLDQQHGAALCNRSYYCLLLLELTLKLSTIKTKFLISIKRFCGESLVSVSIHAAV